LGCHRYAGTDPAILDRVSSAYCDYSVPPPSGSRSAELGSPKFLLLNERPSLVARLWRTIARRSGLDGE
jgi:hypothetical protein